MENIDTTKVAPHNCICCGAEIHRLAPLSWFQEPQDGIFDVGVVTKVDTPFSSHFGGNSLILAICYKCLIEKTAQGVVSTSIGKRARFPDGWELFKRPVDEGQTGILRFFSEGEDIKK